MEKKGDRSKLKETYSQILSAIINNYSKIIQKLAKKNNQPQKKIPKKINYKKFIPILLILLFISLVLYTGVFKKTCFKDSCFDEAIKKCSPVDFVQQKNNNIYLYTISRSIGGECNIKITLKRVSPGTDPEIVKLLEGKSMKCKIPKSFLKNNNLDNLDNILSYCHGELKEGILELILKNLYSLIIGNLDEIVKESKAFLTNLK